MNHPAQQPLEQAFESLDVGTPSLLGSSGGYPPSPNAHTEQHQHEQLQYGGVSAPAIASNSKSYVSSGAPDCSCGLTVVVRVYPAPVSAPSLPVSSLPFSLPSLSTTPVTYSISTLCECDPPRVAGAEVQRRFSDLVWLHQQLTTLPQYGGWLLPPLPEHGLHLPLPQRPSDEFLEERRRAMELFLRRLLSHEALRHSPHLQLFLRADDTQLAAAKAGKSTVLPSSGGSGAGGAGASSSSSSASVASVPSGSSASVWGAYLRDSLTSLSASLTATVAPGSVAKARERSAADVASDAMLEHAVQLETSLASLHTAVESLQVREQRLGKSWFELGLSCGVLGQAEAGAAEHVLAGAFSALAHASSQLSALENQKAEAERLQLSRVLDDQRRIAASVQQMARSRAAALATYQHALSVCDAKQQQQQIEQRAPHTQPSSSGAGSAGSVLADAESVAQRRAAELGEVTRRSQVEFARYRNEKQQVLRDASLLFVRLQIEHSRQVQAAWENVLQRLEAPDERND